MIEDWVDDRRKELQRGIQRNELAPYFFAVSALILLSSFLWQPSALMTGTGGLGLIASGIMWYELRRFTKDLEDFERHRR